MYCPWDVINYCDELLADAQHSQKTTGRIRAGTVWCSVLSVSMKENFYHGMVLCLLQSRGDWLIQSNAELGEGYSDISVCTPDKVGIVIELKYAENGRLDNACAEALTQIEERKYAVGLKRKGMKKIIKYGMAFCEKECMVAMEKD